MIRDYWVYQERQNESSQWALYVVKEFSKGHPEATVLDFTVYCEDIGTPTDSISFVGWHYESVSGYVESLVCEMEEFTRMDLRDREQLERAIARILFD